MSEKLSVRERIERQLEVLLLTVEGVSEVELWSALGNTSADKSIVLYQGNETSRQGGEGDGGFITITARYVASVMIRQEVKDNTEPSSRVVNRWLARVQETLLADQYLIEDATNEPLINDIRYAGSDLPSPEDHEQGSFEIGVGFDIEFDVSRINPYIGPSLTERTV